MTGYLVVCELMGLDKEGRIVKLKISTEVDPMRAIEAVPIYIQDPYYRNPAWTASLAYSRRILALTDRRVLFAQAEESILPDHPRMAMGDGDSPRPLLDQKG